MTKLIKLAGIQSLLSSLVPPPIEVGGFGKPNQRHRVKKISYQKRYDQIRALKNKKGG